MNSSSFLKGRPLLVLVPCGLVDHLDPTWTRVRPVLDRGSFVGFCGPLVNSWFDHCWTVLDSWVILSLGFQGVIGGVIAVL